MEDRYPNTSGFRSASDATNVPQKEIFTKTLGFYCALLRLGCSFPLRESDPDSCDPDLSDSDSDEEASESELDEYTTWARKRKGKCRGRIVLERTSDGVPRIR